MMLSARCVWNVAAKGRPTKPDARGARYQLLVSTLLVPVGHPAAIYRAWQEGYFTLLICAEQLDESNVIAERPLSSFRTTCSALVHAASCYGVTVTTNAWVTAPD
jgi:hypothetical protein